MSSQNRAMSSSGAISDISKAVAAASDSTGGREAVQSAAMLPALGVRSQVASAADVDVMEGRTSQASTSACCSTAAADRDENSVVSATAAAGKIVSNHL